MRYQPRDDGLRGWLRLFTKANQRASYIRRRKAGWSRRWWAVAKRRSYANPMQ